MQGPCKAFSFSSEESIQFEVIVQPKVRLHNQLHADTVNCYNKNFSRFPIDFPSYIVYDDLCTRVIEYDGLNGIGAFILQCSGFVYHFSISSLTLCQGTFFHFIEN